MTVTGSIGSLIHRIQIIETECLRFSIPFFCYGNDLLSLWIRRAKIILIEREIRNEKLRNSDGSGKKGHRNRRIKIRCR